MSTWFDQFLKQLKPLYEAGLINTVGVIATLAAVVVALAPTIWKRWNRPKLALLIKPVSIENIPGNQQRQPTVTTTAHILVKNTGNSAALKVRAVLTDLYVRTSEKGTFQRRDYPQKTLNGFDRDLPAKLSFPVCLLGRKQVGSFDTGFILGEPPRDVVGFATAVGPQVAVAKSIAPAPEMPGGDDPFPEGIYIVRVVVSANNATPTTHSIRIQLTHEAEVHIANWRERRAIKKADRRTAKAEISYG